MRRNIAGIVVLLALSSMTLAQEENLSSDRSLGIGMQVSFPWGGLVSARYWLSPRFGTEGILFVWGTTVDFRGTLTGRLFYRLRDTSVTDFYIAAGVSYPFSRYGEDGAVLSAVGGIEFGFLRARNLAWNVEFGVAVSTLGEIGMAFGTGIHFYF